MEPVVVWNGVIIDGYKRYRICTAEGIDFEYREMQFPSEEEAVSWVCRKRIPQYSHLPFRTSSDLCIFISFSVRCGGYI